MLGGEVTSLYQACGGADIYLAEPFGLRLLAPSEFVPANKALLGKAYDDDRLVYDSDISAFWYVLAKNEREDITVVVDLHPDRYGTCYDAFWETYGIADMPIVSRSVEELIVHIVRNLGKQPLPTIGHAYR